MNGESRPGQTAPTQTKASSSTGKDTTLAANPAAIVAAGIPVFPIVPGGKAPLTPQGFKDATTDPDIIRRWWSRWPNANIGMPTGSGTFDVLDVDVRPNGNGWAAFNRLNESGLLSGALRIVRTPSGGIHAYFPGTAQPSASIPAMHLDLKATGGYVLLPPSRVTTENYTGTYTVEADYGDEATGEILDWQACKSLLSPAPVVIRTSKRGRAEDVRYLADWLRRQGEGNRNRALYWAARRALEQGCHDPSALQEAALAIGLPEREINRTLASAFRRFGGAA